MYHQHVIHDKPFEDCGIFFDKEEVEDEKINHNYATQTTKDLIGQGAKEGCKNFYDVKNGGGFYEGIKEPKYGQMLAHQKICKPTALGIINFPDSEKGYGGTNQRDNTHYMKSESQAGFSQNIKKRGIRKKKYDPDMKEDILLNDHWNNYLISPNKIVRRKDFEKQHHAASSAPFATTVIPRRPTTPLKIQQREQPPLVVQPPPIAVAKQLETIADQPSKEDQLSLPIKPTVPKTSRPNSGVSVRSLIARRKKQKAPVATTTYGPDLQPKYVPILAKTKSDFGFENALRAARSAKSNTGTSRCTSRNASNKRYQKNSTKRSFIPVVAMVRPHLNMMSGFRGLHFRSG